MKSATIACLALTGTVAASILVSGCAGNIIESADTIKIASDPPGATAYASGRKIGVTPLSFKPGDYFNARPVFGEADSIVAIRYVGTLSLERAGCEPYDLSVNDNILSKDIHARLNCSTPVPEVKATTVPVPTGTATTTPVKKPVAAQPALAPVKPLTGRFDDPGDSAEKRLLRLENLRDRGLITDEEYQTLRKRILDTL